MSNWRYITYGIREKVTTLGLNRATLVTQYIFRVMQN
jgi:hypothetical protein